MKSETTQRHIDVMLKRINDLTGLNLTDDQLSQLGYDNHRLVSNRKDTSETDISKRTKSIDQFYDILETIYNLLLEIKKQK